MRHIGGWALKPSPYVIVGGMPVLADGSALATKDQIETHDKHINEHKMHEYLAHHIIINSVLLRLMQKIGQLTSSKEMWDTMKADCKGKSMLYQVDVQWWLQDLKCAEGTDVKAHLTEMGKHWGDLAAMGVEVKDLDYTVIMIGSLPLSYWPLLSPLIGISEVMWADSNDMTQSVLEEYEHHLICDLAMGMTTCWSFSTVLTAPLMNDLQTHCELSLFMMEHDNTSYVSSNEGLHSLRAIVRVDHNQFNPSFLTVQNIACCLASGISQPHLIKQNKGQVKTGSCFCDL